MKIEIMGVKIDNLTFEGAIEIAEGFLRGNDAKFIVTPNPEIVLRAQKDEEFKNILNSSSLAIPDGFGLVLASKLARNSLKEKIAGTDFFQQLCWICSKNGKSVFLLGGEKGVAEKTAENLQIKFPNLKIAGWLDGEVDLENCWKIINDVKPDALFVALGAPKQEKWIYENLNKIAGLKVAMAVGGAFDLVSGEIKRAPMFMRKIGIEWLWRLTIQPRRIKRIFNAVIIFPMTFIFYMTRQLIQMR